MSRDRSGEPPLEGPSYEVGYGKPPQHSRFKPGHSGNPRGRAKGSLNTHTCWTGRWVKRLRSRSRGRYACSPSVK
jgi:hypothetical protein